MSSRISFALLKVASLLVPRDRRAEWLEEWRGELAALKSARAAGVSGLSSTIGFRRGVPAPRHVDEDGGVGVSAP